MFSLQRCQQRLGLLEISGVKALGEPVVDWCQQRMRLGPLALLLPQARQTHGSTQLPGFGLLLASNGQSLMKTGFYLGRIRDRLPQGKQQVAAE